MFIRRDIEIDKNIRKLLRYVNLTPLVEVRKQCPSNLGPCTDHGICTLPRLDFELAYRPRHYLSYQLTKDF